MSRLFAVHRMDGLRQGTPSETQRAWPETLPSWMRFALKVRRAGWTARTKDRGLTPSWTTCSIASAALPLVETNPSRAQS